MLAHSIVLNRGAGWHRGGSPDVRYRIDKTEKLIAARAQHDIHELSRSGWPVELPFSLRDPRMD